MRVVIKLQEDGTFDGVWTDEPCEVVTVCDHCPNDRVYRLTDAHTVGREAVDTELRGDAVGHSKDERHGAVAHKINALLDGKKHLKPVN